MLKYFIILIILPSLSLAFKSKNPDEFPIISYKVVSADFINKKISKAKKNNEKWISSPLSIIQKVFQTNDVRFTNIKQQNDRAECALRSVITIVEEGFLDDQLRGRWRQFHLERKDCTSSWKVKEMREAFLCGVLGYDEVFLKDLCPLK